MKKIDNSSKVVPSSRALDAREYEERQYDELPSFVEAYKGSLHIPETVKAPEGMVYAWIVESVNNEVQYQNMQQAARRGYRPVPADRHPEFGMIHLKDMYAQDISHNKILIGGQCLMERPQSYHDREKEYQDRLTKQREDSISWTNPDAHPMMPNFVQSNERSFQSFGK